jgi:hypothetical protein
MGVGVGGAATMTSGSGRCPPQSMTNRGPAMLPLVVVMSWLWLAPSRLT